MEEKEKIKISIEEIRIQRTEQKESMTKFREVGKTLLQSSGIIISIVTTLQITFSKVTANNIDLYNSLLILLGCLFALLVVLCIYIIAPKKWNIAFPNTYNELLQSFTVENDETGEKQILTNYCDVLSKNRKIIKTNNTLSIIAMVIYALIVILLLIMGFIPRTSA